MNEPKICDGLTGMRKFTPEGYYEYKCGERKYKCYACFELQRIEEEKQELNALSVNDEVKKDE